MIWFIQGKRREGGLYLGLEERIQIELRDSLNVFRGVYVRGTGAGAGPGAGVRAGAFRVEEPALLGVVAPTSLERSYGSM